MFSRRLMHHACLIATAASCVAFNARAGDLGHTTTFDDPLNLGQPYYAWIDSHLAAALASWGEHIQGQASFEILVRISPDIPTISAASATSAWLTSDSRGAVFEQGMAHELRTGLDPNGALADIVIQINPAYLQHGLWFDPDVSRRTAAVPQDRVDATSVFIHELGHALAFNGWGQASSLPTTAMSPWDRNVSFESGAASFVGASATALYGGPVPVTLGFDFHVGNAYGPGSDLRGDVMNGVSLQEGTRYGVSALDLAMLQDMGIMVSHAPEPATFGLMLMGLAGLVSLRRTRRSIDNDDASPQASPAPRHHDQTSAPSRPPRLLL